MGFLSSVGGFAAKVAERAYNKSTDYVKNTPITTMIADIAIGTANGMLQKGQQYGDKKSEYQTKDSNELRNIVKTGDNTEKTAAYAVLKERGDAPSSN